ncbi:phosphohydrolase [Alsobacter metallidurans]|uniref:Phosphohydrolase n=1 Tax=Alsobacter metallidurans TaxID=340221 RepID=A0A917I6S4_9HYPH|nr:metallophosphoesterase [Alsobacter metallidurans]GGH16390.1 phosphohydrolase [Alsobacter metallidurans]
MYRVLQISDTHLSPSKRHFERNWEPLREWVKAQAPDLVIHTGDITVDGADDEEDMRHCAQIMADLGAPMLSVPGNHDVGEAHHPHQPVNGERLARWRRHFGDDFWSHDLENWRLIGLDSMLLGSGHQEEERQFDWLKRQLAEANGRKLAIFTHRPLFVYKPCEGDQGYWSVTPEPRAHLIDLIRRYDVAMVASGHLHRAHDQVVDGARYIWGPSSSFVVGPDLQPEMPGSRELGAVLYTFDGASFTAEVRRLETLETLWIDDVIHEVYPPRAA